MSVTAVERRTYFIFWRASSAVRRTCFRSSTDHVKMLYGVDVAAWRRKCEKKIPHIYNVRNALRTIHMGIPPHLRILLCSSLFSRDRIIFQFIIFLFSSTKEEEAGGGGQKMMMLLLLFEIIVAVATTHPPRSFKPSVFFSKLFDCARERKAFLPHHQSNIRYICSSVRRT